MSSRDRWKQWLPRHVMKRIVCFCIVFLVALQILNYHNSDVNTPILRRRTHTPQVSADLLSQIASQYSINSRGIVIPLFDGIATLGMSLILELRSYAIHLPIEVPYCGDLSRDRQTQLREMDPSVRLYDACEMAANIQTASSSEYIFCTDLQHCYKKFRSFDLKILAVILSEFEQVMLMDADTLYFSSPMALWDMQSYILTGTMFFPDRITYSQSYLAKRVIKGREKIGSIHTFLANFNVTLYNHLTAIPRQRTVLSRLVHFPLSFEPSFHLLTSHPWNLRSGHEMDSSLLLWNKHKQPRATAILASFITGNSSQRPLIYGDKDLFFIACELAETAYSISDLAVGSIGTQYEQGNATLCGDAVHYIPQTLRSLKYMLNTNISLTNHSLAQDADIFYINSDEFLDWNFKSEHIYRTLARNANHFPGTEIERKLDPSCLFNVKATLLTPEQAQHIIDRQQWHRKVEKQYEEEYQSFFLRMFH